MWQYSTIHKALLPHFNHQYRAQTPLLWTKLDPGALKAQNSDANLEKNKKVCPATQTFFEFS